CKPIVNLWWRIHPHPGDTVPNRRIALIRSTESGPRPATPTHATEMMADFPRTPSAGQQPLMQPGTIQTGGQNMKVKSLLLGSAAALVANAAHSADAIVIAGPEPIEYVRVCDAYGAGFFYIPGTETCLRIGGELRFQLGATNDHNDYESYFYEG